MNAWKKQCCHLCIGRGSIPGSLQVEHGENNQDIAFGYFYNSMHHSCFMHKIYILSFDF